MKLIVIFMLPPDSLDVPQELKALQCSEQTKLEYFVPQHRYQAAGFCSFQLINYLAKLQNEMIESSWIKADEYGTR